MCALCEHGRDFIPWDKSWQERLAWRCGNTHPRVSLVCCLDAYVLIRVYKLRHRHLNTGCLDTAAWSSSFRGVCARELAGACACARVHENECLAQSFLPRARGQTATVKNKKRSQVCVTADWSLTHQVCRQHAELCVSSCAPVGPVTLEPDSRPMLRNYSWATTLFSCWKNVFGTTPTRKLFLKMTLWT